MGPTVGRFSSLVVSHMDHFQIPSVTIKNGLAAEATQGSSCKSMKNELLGDEEPPPTGTKLFKPEDVQDDYFQQTTANPIAAEEETTTTQGNPLVRPPRSAAGRALDTASGAAKKTLSLIHI